MNCKNSRHKSVEHYGKKREIYHVKSLTFSSFVTNNFFLQKCKFRFGLKKNIFFKPNLESNFDYVRNCVFYVEKSIIPTVVPISLCKSTYVLCSTFLKWWQVFCSIMVLFCVLESIELFHRALEKESIESTEWLTLRCRHTRQII